MNRVLFEYSHFLYPKVCFQKNIIIIILIKTSLYSDIYVANKCHVSLSMMYKIWKFGVLSVHLFTYNGGGVIISM